MNDLFKKLNTLVKASINDLLGDDLSISGPRRRPLHPDRLGKNIDTEVEALRARVNDAIVYEDQLQARVQELQDEIDRWDRQADEAVTQHNDSAARYAVEQMQRAQQRLAMAESDLREHQLVTQELIQRVNTLDAVVADARRAQAEKAAETEAETEAESAEQSDTTARTPGQVLSDVLRESRQTISRMGEMITTRETPESPESDTEGESAPADNTDESTVEDDLERRRQRLSKPK